MYYTFAGKKVLLAKSKIDSSVVCSLREPSFVVLGLNHCGGNFSKTKLPHLKCLSKKTDHQPFFRREAKKD